MADEFGRPTCWSYSIALRLTTRGLGDPDNVDGVRPRCRDAAFFSPRGILLWTDRLGAAERIDTFVDLTIRDAEAFFFGVSPTWGRHARTERNMACIR